ncbi:MAG: VanZ family protein [Lachnospiraceae bacterium]|nr:VanZ family protein [Lachnospiraceae bacterium]
MILEALYDIAQAYQEYKTQALLFGMAGAVIFLIISLLRAFILFITGKESRPFGRAFLRIILFALLSFYLSYVVYLTLSGREAGSRDGINLDLFSTVFVNGRISVHGIENILLFIPFGILIPILWKFFRKGYRLVILALFASVLIETVQLLTHRGFFELDDMLLNTFGAWFGYVAGYFFSMPFAPAEDPLPGSSDKEPRSLRK